MIYIFKLALSYTFPDAWSYTIFLFNWKYLKLRVLNHSFRHSLCTIVIFFWILKWWGFHLTFLLGWFLRLFIFILIKFHFHCSEFISRIIFCFYFNLWFLNLTFPNIFYFLKFFYNFLLYRYYFLFWLRLIFWV